MSKSISRRRVGCSIQREDILQPIMRRVKSIRKIKESVLDKAFSLFIRRRDGRCVFPLRDDKDFHSGNLQCSHFYGRSARSVRFDLENCDAICGRHHQFLEGRKNAEYFDWKFTQLGAERFHSLKRRYATLRRRPPTEKV